MLAIGCMGFGGPSVLEPLSSRPPSAERSRCASGGGRQCQLCGPADQARVLSRRRDPVPRDPGTGRRGNRGDGRKPGRPHPGRPAGLAFPHTGTYAEYVVADGNLTFPHAGGAPGNRPLPAPGDLHVLDAAAQGRGAGAGRDPADSRASGENRHHCDPGWPGTWGRQESSALSAALPSGRRPWMPERTTCFACRTAPLPRPCWIKPAAEGRM